VAAILSVYREGVLHCQVELPPDGVRLGRGPENEVVLEDPQKRVSRCHAELRWEEGRLILTDLHSANGTLVNGVRIEVVELPPHVPAMVGPYRLMWEEAEPVWGSGSGEGTGVPGESLIRPDSAVAGPPIPESEPGPEETTAGRWSVGNWLRSPRGALALGVVAAVLVAAVAGVWVLRGDSATSGGPAPVSKAVVSAEEHLRAARALLDAGAPARALSEHIEPVLAVQPDHAVALGLRELAQARIDAERSPVEVVPPVVEPAPDTAAENTTLPTPSTRSPRPPRETVAERALKQRYDEAHAALEAGDFERAQPQIEAILAESPDYRDTPTLLERARSLRRAAALRAFDAGADLESADNLPAALVEYERARRLDRTVVDGLDDKISRVRLLKQQIGEAAFVNGRTYYNFRRTAEAKVELQKALRYLEPSHESYAEARKLLDRLGGSPP
jgi:tetratricopeptide (TPR) repeat protein